MTRVCMRKFNKQAWDNEWSAIKKSSENDTYPRP